RGSSSSARAWRSSPPGPWHAGASAPRSAAWARSARPERETRRPTRGPRRRQPDPVTTHDASAAPTGPTAPPGAETPFRYTAALPDQIERRSQDRWAERGTFFTPNPLGAL